MKKAIITILAASTISAQATTIVPAVLTFSGGSGTISTGGVQVGTFTLSTNPPAVAVDGDTLHFEASAGTYQMITVMTNADYFISGNNWGSTAYDIDGSITTIGGSNIAGDFSVNSGTEYSIGQADFYYNGVITTGAISGSYVADDIITSIYTAQANSPLTADGMWTISGANADSILTIGSSIDPSASSNGALGRESVFLQIELSQVPEPTSAALLGLGGLALLARRRR